ncbi:MAG: L,D-transpeptidase [Candidatus Binatia bacterium]
MDQVVHGTGRRATGPSIVLTALLLFSNVNMLEGHGVQQPTKRLLRHKPPAQQARTQRLITYRLEARVANRGNLWRRFTERQLRLLELLNRCDLNHLTRQARLVVPDRWNLDPLAYSPLPRRYAWAEPYPKVLVVHQPSQAFGGYERGNLIRWGPVSSGRAQYPTPTGLFHLNWKSRGRQSTLNPHWFLKWYFNFSNVRGISFHAYGLPGFPASHACVRLLDRDARWLFTWGEQWQLGPRGISILRPGTPVRIVGRYQFNAPPPWRSLPWLQRGADLPEGAPLLETSSITALRPPPLRGSGRPPLPQ